MNLFVHPFYSTLGLLITLVIILPWDDLSNMGALRGKLATIVGILIACCLAVGLFRVLSAPPTDDDRQRQTEDETLKAHYYEMGYCDALHKVNKFAEKPDNWCKSKP